MTHEKRLIDANALSNAVAESQYYNPHPPGRVHINHINEHNHFLRMILDAPTVDAVEVVRCKGCEKQRTCRYAQYLGEDGFCSYGERKDK